MKNQKLPYIAVPAMCTLLLLWYIKNATCDVVYTDYIRLINTYLPDVWNIHKFLVPDVLTRIPANYLVRILNVTFFGYSTILDMCLGALGLCLAGLVVSEYVREKKLGFGWMLPLMLVTFSLNKWEMLTNGSGWAHFAASGVFLYHYLLIDRIWSGQEKKKDRSCLLWIPSVTILALAGPYCASYVITLLVGYGFLWWLEGRKSTGKFAYLPVTLAVVIPFLLYLWSNCYAVEDHAGAVTDPFLPSFLSRPVFFLRFFIKSFAGIILGGETIMEFPGWRWWSFLLGMAVIALYLLAFWLYRKYQLQKESVFPLLLMISGGFNHLLITYGRWIFWKEDYGMSSRYTLQYQVGILGIILTFALVGKRLVGSDMALLKTGMALGIGMIILGNGITSARELRLAPYREENFELAAEVALNYEQESDETLKTVFRYRSGEKTREALTILKENQWNVFR